MQIKKTLLALSLAASAIHADAILNAIPTIGLRVESNDTYHYFKAYLHQGGLNVSGVGAASVAGSGIFTPGGNGLRVLTQGTEIHIGKDGGSDWLHLTSSLATFTGDVKVPGKLLIGTAGWSIKAPDFVFAPGYKLQPLSEVEAFVKKNRHLPGIASASEMESGKAVDLVQMNLDLLKKVEELTLHVIEQDKKIESLRKTSGSKI